MHMTDRRSQRGVSLIVVLLILIVVSILGVGGAQIALMAERGARNDRDMQVAWQAAETALLDAEMDIHGPAGATRAPLLGSLQNTNEFVAGCGKASDGPQRVGLCSLVDAGKPAWLTVDFKDASAAARSAAFGQFTGRHFSAGQDGITPFQAPRYVIEPIVDPGNRDLTKVRYLYRITAMGFGPRQDIQAVAQTIYRN